MHINTSAVFISSVSRALGFAVGDFALYRTIQGLTAALLLPTAARILEKKKLKPVLITAASVLCLTTFLTSGFRYLWQFYAASLVSGVAYSFIGMLLVPIVIDKWFDKNRALTLSVASSMSGLVGIVASPLLAQLISTYSWQTGYIALGLCCLCGCAVAALLLDKSPEEAGFPPLAAQNTTETGTPVPAAPFRLWGLTPLLGVFVVAVFLGSTGFGSHVSNYALSAGFGLVQAASFNSVMMVGNMTSKLLLGRLCDRLGATRTAILGAFICVGGFVLISFSDNVPFMYSGAALCGLTYSLGAVVAPNMVRELFAANRYSEVLAVYSMAGSFASAAAIALMGYAYDLTGGYAITLRVLQVLMLCSAAALILVRRRNNKNKQLRAI